MDSKIIQKVAHRLNDTFHQDIIDSLNILGQVGTEEEVIAVLEELVKKNICQKRQLLIAFAHYLDCRTMTNRPTPKYIIDEFIQEYINND